MLSFTEDIVIFFATIYGGISIGVLFDIYRACKYNFNVIKTFSILYDIVFWIVVTALVFITINVAEAFNLRYYHFIALFVGFIILQVLQKLYAGHFGPGWFNSIIE